MKFQFSLKTKVFLPVVSVITLAGIAGMYFSSIIITNLINRQVQQQETMLQSEVEETAEKQVAQIYNRVTGGFSPPVPTTPGMRVRTGRFTQPIGP